MSSSGNRNDDSGPSQQDLELHYHQMMVDDDDDDDDDYHQVSSDDDEDEDMEDAEEQGGNGEETTASGAGGSETSSQAKKHRRERRPNRVGTTREQFIAISVDGVPTEPKSLAKGYFLQLAAILRDTVSLNEVELRKKNKEHLRVQLIKRLHARYEFPGEYNNEDLKTNKVNTLALSRFSKALSGFKTQVRKMLKKGDGYAKIHHHFPKVTENVLEVFMANENLDFAKSQTAWGKMMRDKNIGNHNLGCRGYDGKEDIWEAEDQAYRDAGLEPPFDKYNHHLQTKRFLRSRYHKENEDGELVTNPKKVQGVVLVTDPKVKEVEEALIAEEQEESASSSQTSTANVPWNIPLVRALNMVKNKSPLKRPHMGRVTGAGLNRKHVNHGLAEPRTKESRAANKSREREDTGALKHQLAELEANFQQRVEAAVADRINDAVAQRVNELMPAMMQSLAGYIAAGAKGPLPVISLAASNSHNVAPRDDGAPRENAPPMLVTPAAGNAGAREDSPALGSAGSPSVTCTPAVYYYRRRTRVRRRR